MHILGIILGLIVAGVIWYQRIKIAAEAGSKAIDAAQRAKGKVVRKRKREAAAFAPISAVDHPVVAAATLMRFVIGDEAWGATRPRAVGELREIADEATVEEAIAYAEWAARQVEHERRSIDELSAKLREWLDPTERGRLAAMLEGLVPDEADAHARHARAVTGLGAVH